MLNITWIFLLTFNFWNQAASVTLPCKLLWWGINFKLYPYIQFFDNLLLKKKIIASVCVYLIDWSIMASFIPGGLAIWIRNRRHPHWIKNPCKGLEVRSLHARSSSLSGVCSTGWTNLDDPTKEVGNRFAWNIDERKKPHYCHPYC
jgi:hypothetical protein